MQKLYAFLILAALFIFVPFEAHAQTIPPGADIGMMWKEGNDCYTIKPDGTASAPQGCPIPPAAGSTDGLWHHQNFSTLCYSYNATTGLFSRTSCPPPPPPPPAPESTGSTSGASIGVCGPGALPGADTNILTIPGQPNSPAAGVVYDDLLQCSYDMGWGGLPPKELARTIVGRDWVGDATYKCAENECFHADWNGIKKVQCQTNTPVLPNGQMPSMYDKKFDWKGAGAKCYHTLGDIGCGQYGISGERICGISSSDGSAARLDDPASWDNRITPPGPDFMACTYCAKSDSSVNPEDMPPSLSCKMIGKDVVGKLSYKNGLDGKCYRREFLNVHEITCTPNLPVLANGSMPDVLGSMSQEEFMAGDGHCYHILGDLTCYQYGLAGERICGLRSGSTLPHVGDPPGTEAFKSENSGLLNQPPGPAWTPVITVPPVQTPGAAPVEVTHTPPATHPAVETPPPAVAKAPGSGSCSPGYPCILPKTPNDPSKGDDGPNLLGKNRYKVLSD